MPIRYSRIHRVRSFECTGGEVTTLSFSTDGQFLAAGCAGGGLEWWATETAWSMSPHLDDDDEFYHDSSVVSAAFTFDNRYLISCSSYDCRAIVWDRQTGKALSHVTTLIADEELTDTDMTRITCMSRSFLENQVLIGVHWWGLSADVAYCRGEEHLIYLGLASDPAEQNGQLMLWRPFEKALINYESPGLIDSIAVSRGGRFAALAGRLGDKRGTYLWRLDLKSGELAPPVEVDFRPETVAWLPDSRRALIGGTVEEGHLPNNTPFLLVDLSTQEVIRRFTSPENSFRVISAARDGTQVLTSHTDCLRVWDVGTGNELAHYLGPCGGGPSCISSDGKLVASSNGTTVHLWKVPSDK